MTSDGKSDKTGSQPIIPRGELPCVWMTAGVLSFRLCDRGLACQECPLEHALRNIPGVAAAAPKATPRRTTPGGCLVPEGRFFHAGHTWVKLLPGGEFEVGLDDFGGRVAGEVVRVSLPSAGDHLTVGESTVGLVGKDTEIKLRAPFSGAVSRANGTLRGDPMLVRREPYGAGYLYRARPSDPARALSGLIPNEEALAFTTEQENLLLALVDVATARAGDVFTQNDGGLLSDHLLAGVPPVQAERIRNWIFNAPMNGREARER